MYYNFFSKNIKKNLTFLDRVFKSHGIIKVWERDIIFKKQRSFLFRRINKKRKKICKRDFCLKEASHGTFFKNNTQRT